MVPGPKRIHPCPSCGGLFAEQTWASGGSAQAVLWSDGTVEGPVLPLPLVLAVCPSCRKPLWLRKTRCLGEVRLTDLLETPGPESDLTLVDAGRNRTAVMFVLRKHFPWSLEETTRALGEVPLPLVARAPASEVRALRDQLEGQGALVAYHETPAATPHPRPPLDWLRAPLPLDVSEPQALAMLRERDFETPEDECWLRLHAWRQGNAPFRRLGQPWRAFCDRPLDVKANAERLLELLGDTPATSRLLKAELARELRSFELAAALLDFDFPAELGTIARHLREQVFARDDRVCEVPLERADTQQQ